MTEKTRNILFIRFFENTTAYDFENLAEAGLRQLKGADELLFCMDNHSDAAIVGYAKKLLGENAQTVLICHFEEETHTLGSALPILNLALRVRPKLYSNHDSSPIQPFLQKMKGETYEDSAQLLRLVF